MNPVRVQFGNYHLCDACSHGHHVDHRPVNCDCDLCTEEAA